MRAAVIDRDLVETNASARVAMISVAEDDTSKCLVQSSLQSPTLHAC